MIDYVFNIFYNILEDIIIVEAKYYALTVSKINIDNILMSI